jgi:Zn-dependent protease
MQISTIIFEIIVLIFSVIIHEISHGFVAEKLGDPTARLQGRLTLNPLKHIDPVGSIIVPIVTSLVGFTFGWAKPVPFNPYNLKNRRTGELLIAIAGPISNLLLALVFGTIIRLALAHPEASIFTSATTSAFALGFIQLSAYVVIINLALAVFNLIPLPPLDGSKVLFAAFPRNQKWNQIRAAIEQYSIFLVLILVVFLWQFVTPILPILFRLFTGASF